MELAESENVWGHV